MSRLLDLRKSMPEFLLFLGTFVLLTPAWSLGAQTIKISPGDVLVVDQVEAKDRDGTENRLFEIDRRSGVITELPALGSNIAIDINGYAYRTEDGGIYVTRNGIYEVDLITGIDRKICCKQAKQEELLVVSAPMVVDKEGFIYQATSSVDSEGRIVRVDPARGSAKVISRRGLLGWGALMGGVAFDHKGWLVVAFERGSRTSKLVRVHPRTGRQREFKVRPDLISGPDDVVANRKGHIIVSDGNNIFDVRGRSKLRVIVKDRPFFNAHKIAITSSGLILTATPFKYVNRNTILQVNPRSGSIMPFASGFSFPQDVAVIAPRRCVPQELC